MFNLRGAFFSSIVRNLRNLLLLVRALNLNDLKLICCMPHYWVRKYDVKHSRCKNNFHTNIDVGFDWGDGIAIYESIGNRQYAIGNWQTAIINLRGFVRIFDL